MDQEHYKQHKTQRGFTYSYFFSPPASQKPVLFFFHGFPSCAYSWYKEVTFFKGLGYGIIAPDLLGYGKTDKPTDPRYYVGSGLAQDVIDILDAEKIEKVMAISHDWGSRLVSRIINYFPARVSGCAFLAVGYGPPDSHNANPIAQSEKLKQMVGYDVMAYMHFFTEEETPALIEEKFDSFFSLLFPIYPSIWRDHMCVAGGAKKWIQSNTKTALPSYMPEKDKEYYKESLLGGGMTAPLCWYKVLVQKYCHDDDAAVPAENIKVKVPVLFVPFNKDAVVLPIFGDTAHAHYVNGEIIRKDLDCDHWGVLSHADELNGMLLEWLEVVG